MKVNMSRLLLCEATANVIATGFHVLGINPLEKMWWNWHTKSISKPFNTAKLEDLKSNCTTLVNRKCECNKLYLSQIYIIFFHHEFFFLLRFWQLARIFFLWDLRNIVCQVMFFTRINPWKCTSSCWVNVIVMWFCVLKQNRGLVMDR